MIALILNITIIIIIIILLKRKKTLYNVLASILGVFLGFSFTSNIVIRNNIDKFYITSPGEVTETICKDIIYEDNSVKYIELENGEIFDFNNKDNMYVFTEQFYDDNMIAYKLEVIKNLKNKVFNIISGVPLQKKSVYIEIMIPNKEFND